MHSQETRSNKSSEIPQHLSLILDGNRRWARERGLPTLEGHREGYDNLKTIAKAAIKRGVVYVSAFIFSTENWNRTPAEVKYLMNLAYKMLTKDVDELNKENIRVIWLGRLEGLSKRLIKAIKEAEAATANNTEGTLALCFNYGGQQEIVDAARQLADSGQEITEESFAEALYTPELPAVDLLVRTSGEHRLSNFMTWRTAYAELYFTDTYWPDFDESDLDTALNVYKKRHRRFGS